MHKIKFCVDQIVTSLAIIINRILTSKYSLPRGSAFGPPLHVTGDRHTWRDNEQGGGSNLIQRTVECISKTVGS